MTRTRHHHAVERRKGCHSTQKAKLRRMTPLMSLIDPITGILVRSFGNGKTGFFEFLKVVFGHFWSYGFSNYPTYLPLYDL